MRTSSQQPVLDVGLEPKNSDAQALTTSPSLEIFERLVKDPAASIDKIERLMALWERGEAKKAEAAFNAAMAQAQRVMRPIAADAYNPQTKSKYASYAQLDAALRPIYTDHGFGLSFNTTDSPLTDHVRVVCKATHAGGHSELYRLDMPADGKGAKGGDVMTKTHATASALTYGQRYLLKMIWNVAVGEERDDDGNAAGDTTERPSAPKGYEEFVVALAGAAGQGTKALYPLWNQSDERLRQHMTRHDRGRWEELKKTAAKATA